ncbi:class I tRNA ligase family protein [Mangrovihabitans endophyticus]|uniref:Cysteine--tRNA ligase n=1 Tax=Mangrovihabitans endophyticus TaxID=1751298 RepID=A0A8J3C2I8_9ACTN|nr:class I tRNA ligase family protein [Mangrovihabitans endophyticus]GGL05942.1 cysteine--tRNA ligase [Mangrovihabitans endophyticus]
MKLYCTKSRDYVEVPHESPVNLYVCGITPYDSMHVGHIAMLLTYDVLIRRLRSLNRPVRMVRNITDVDDPLLPKAQSLDVPYWDLVESEIAQFGADEKALDLVRADAEPRASANIDQIVATIEELLTSGHAYRLDDHIYFSVATDPQFGSLAEHDRDQMIKLSGENGGDPERPGKRDPLDFILWQPARPGEPEYSGTLGIGRPGWHIGCSVMSRRELGSRIDIHGGGADLVYPHHECEISQNRSVDGGSLVQVWLHSGLVGYQGQKMSKSRGNIVLARDVIGRYDARALRLGILAHYHHRHEMEWFDEYLDDATDLLRRLIAASGRSAGPSLTAYAERLAAHLDNDLDFPAAVGELQAAADAMEGGGDDPTAPGVLTEMAALLGVDLSRPVLADGR